MASVIGRRTGFRRAGRTELGRRHDRCVPVITTDTSNIIAIIMATVIGRRTGFRRTGGTELGLWHDRCVSRAVPIITQLQLHWPTTLRQERPSSPLPSRPGRGPQDHFSTFQA